MVKNSCWQWIRYFILLFLVPRAELDLIEIVEEQQCSDQEFRLTCRNLESHIAILEAWYTSIAEVVEENATTTPASRAIDAELDRVFVYSSPNRDGFFEEVRPSARPANESNATDEVLNELVNQSFVSEDASECGVRSYVKSYSSWKHGQWTVSKNESTNLRFPVSYRCTGVNHCNFVLEKDYPSARGWPPGAVFIKYACFDDSLSYHFCNLEVDVAATGGDSEGYIRTPGYPHFYSGGGDCYWRVHASAEQLIRITVLDLDLRSVGPFENECTDFITVTDGTGDILLSSCDQLELPLKIISKTNSLKINMKVNSKGVFPKRGILLHYKSVNCVTLPAPSSGYLVYRDTKVAHYLCNENHVFIDSRQRARILWCYDDNRWNDTVPVCVGVAELVSGSDEDDLQSDKLRPRDPNMLVDIVIPSLLIAALFIGNAFIVLIIYKYRKRKPDEIEDEDYNTIPLSVNGNNSKHSAGNPV